MKLKKRNVAEPKLVIKYALLGMYKSLNEAAKPSICYIVLSINCSAKLIARRNIACELSFHFSFMNNIGVSFIYLFTYLTVSKNVSFKILPISTASSTYFSQTLALFNSLYPAVYYVLRNVKQKLI